MQENDLTYLYYRRNLLILSVSVLLSAISWSQIVPFLPFFLRDLGVPQDHLMRWSGIVFAAQSVASIVTLPFWGKMGDKYGRKPMTVRAGLFLAGIYFGMSVCRAPWQLVTLRFLNGALTGFIPGSMALVATNTPKEKAPRAVATAQTFSAVGQILGPPIGGVLAQAMGGYRPSMVVSGTAVLVCTIALWLFVKEINKPQIAEKTSLMEDFTISIKSPVLSSVMLTLLVVAIFGASMNAILSIHLTSIDPKITLTRVGMVFALIPFAFALSAYLWTAYGERNGPQRSIMIGLIGAALCSMVLATVNSFYVFGAVFFAAGVFLASASPSAGAIICNRVSSDFQGRAYGMLWSASTVGALIGPILAPAVGSALGTRAVFVFVGVLLLLGMLKVRTLVQRWSDKTTRSLV